MNCLQLICAQSVVTDKTTNQVSVINIYETVIPPSIPFIIPAMALFAQFEKEESDPVELTFTLIIRLAGNLLYNQPIAISFIEPESKNNTTVNMQGLLINQPGILSFNVEYAG